MPANTTREIIQNLRKREAELLAELDEVRRVIAAVEPLDRSELTGEFQSDNIPGNMNTQPMHPLVRQQHSRSINAATGVQRLLDDLHAVGIPSLRSLAQMARDKFGGKTQQAHLSLAATGERPIDRALAEWIETLTKGRHKATKTNWPKLRD